MVLPAIKYRQICCGWKYGTHLLWHWWTQSRHSWFRISLDFSAFCAVNYLRLSFYYSLILSVYLCILCAATCVINEWMINEWMNVSRISQIEYAHITTRPTNPSKGCQLVTLCRPGLTYIFNFWHSGTLALSPQCQSARMSEIKNEDKTWMALTTLNHLMPLHFKGLKM